MRLIDADAFEKFIRKNCTDSLVDLWCELVRRQPTSYDVDKVIKEINEWTFNANIDVGDGTVMNHNLIVRDTAIEIVKAGGKSDNNL